MIRFASLAGAALLVLAAAGTTASTGCSSDSSSEPETNICDEISFSSRAEIRVPTRCTSINSSVSGITYDQFSRPTSYNFSISCTDGSQSFSGRVSNIAWNNLGEALSMDVTINGKNCRHTR